MVDSQLPAISKAALLRMRSIEHTKVLWIDQVCIDQDDTSERSLLVPRMGAFLIVRVPSLYMDWRRRR